MAAHAWGEPPASGEIRRCPEDFRVTETLGFEPDGEGEHLWLEVEKRGRNTADVAAELAVAAGIGRRSVSFAGLKDRNALTRQTFSLHLPGCDDPDWQAWSIEGVKILKAHRSGRKLRRGRLSGNRFDLVVDGLAGDLDRLAERLCLVAAAGVPNGFGEQRFGGNNIARAHQLFRGELRGKAAKRKRGFYLSAARSLIFNRVLAERIAQGNWNRLIDGDIAMLDGSRSIFAADADDPEQIRRIETNDIHPTGPLVGQGKLPVSGQARVIEEAVLVSELALTEGLARFGMQQQRRALRVVPADMSWRIENNRLSLSFSLPAGSFATAVLREIVRYTDASKLH